MKLQKKVLVSWVSFNNDPYERNRDGSYTETKTQGPTLQFLFNPHSPVYGQVQKLYLFVRSPIAPDPHARKVDGNEEQVAQALKTEIKQHSSDIEVIVRPWETDSAPTDHEPIFKFTVQELAIVRRANPKAEIVVNLSPGTPAMQTGMLMALQWRIAGENVQAFQTVPVNRRKNEKEVAREVPWNLIDRLAAIPMEQGKGSAYPEQWTFDNAKSAALKQVAKLIDEFGSVPFPVLIVGARGTGKSEVARRLRKAFLEWTERTDTPWDFRLNCAEFVGDANMLRSALFGQMAGAHSTATHDEAGLLERAQNDCVLLDEIHWMDRRAQGLLLVALQRGGRFRRLGGTKDIPSTFRLLAVTNQAREKLKEALIPDFFDRIADLVIELPPLRECREDLDGIWRSVVWRACDELLRAAPTRYAEGKPEERLGNMAREFSYHHAHIVEAITRMRLPGNFRDLEKLARRLIVAGLNGQRILSVSAELVKREIARLRKEERMDPQSTGHAGGELVDELPTLQRCEEHLQGLKEQGLTLSEAKVTAEWNRRLILAARSVTANEKKAAALVEMEPRTFNDRLRKWTATADAKGLNRTSRRLKLMEFKL